ncbi:MAG: hypothetical protein HY567_02460 [Candidatus Kerfeldbacteria bacterium]|nr:hypothetical protein [Candidatus Kerfeldbacteria bacterium]
MVNPFRWLFNRRPRRRDFAAPPTERRNPLFVEYRRPSGPWLVLIGLLIVGGLTYTLWSPRWRITRVEVTGTERLDPASIERFVNAQLNQGLLGVNWRRVAFLTPTGTLARDLRRSIERVVSINRVTVARTDTHSLRVSIQERQPKVIWQTTFNRRFILDDRGIIIERAPTDRPAGLLILTDRNDLSTVIGTAVVQPSLLTALATVDQRLPPLGVEVDHYATWKIACLETPPPAQERTLTINATDNPSAITINGNANHATKTNQSINQPRADEKPCNLAELAVREPTLVVKTTEAWELRLDSSGNLDAQLEKLRVALTERLNRQRQQLQYIDVRFGDRVFYQ